MSRNEKFIMQIDPYKYLFIAKKIILFMKKFTLFTSSFYYLFIIFHHFLHFRGFKNIHVFVMKFINVQIY